jgi:DUF4097 and DUF4098 domain-containing protein YvlB
VTLSNAGARIVVSAWDEDRVRIHALAGEGIRVDASPTRVTLDAATTRRAAGGSFEVTVPRGTRVIARTTSGDVTVRDTRGDCEIQTQSGSVTVERVGARCEIHTVVGDVDAVAPEGDLVIGTASGDVAVADSRGAVEIQTIIGDILLRRVSSRSVTARTTSGEVEFEGTPDPAGRYEFVSHSGDIRLALGRQPNAQLALATWSGVITTEFAVTLKPGLQAASATQEKRFTFDLGAGTARVSATSFSGDIRITSAPARPRSSR